MRRSERLREANSRRRSALRTVYKKIVKNIEKGEREQAQENYHIYTKMIDTAARKNLVKANKASRHKSRLAKRINKMTQ